MKKLILALTILMLVTLNSFAGGKPSCLKPEYKSYQKSNWKGHRMKCSPFKKAKHVKAKEDRFHNTNLGFN